MFNLLAGRTIQEAFGVVPQVALTLPILEGVDGVQRMSKSLGNYIGISESPKQIFGKVMSIPDNLIYSYFKLTTDVDAKTLVDIKAALETENVNPMEYKKRLGETSGGDVSFPRGGGQCPQPTSSLFFQKSKSRMICRKFGWSAAEFAEKNEIYWPKFLADHKLADSSSKARNLIKQGGFSIDGEKNEWIFLRPCRSTASIYLRSANYIGQN